ncbi:ENTH domain-containing protein [Pseudoscourfieldia marina]
MEFLSKLQQRARQVAYNLSDLELKVEEATNLDPWGPHGSLMSDIASSTLDRSAYAEIMGVIARRLQSPPESWRHIYKSLLLLEHLIKHGSTRVVDELRQNMSAMERLKRFQYKDQKGQDQGLNVRNRAELLISLLESPDQIREEREKARKNREKYSGVSSEDMRTGAYGGGGNARSSGSNYRSNDDWDSKNNASSFSSDSTARKDLKSHYGLGGSGGGGGGADAFNATQDRIAKLKVQDSSSFEPRFAGASGETTEATASPFGATFKAGGASASKAPRFLSETKVDPKIAAGLGKISLAPPAATTSPSQATPAPSDAAASLFGAFDSAPAVVPAPAMESAGGGGGVWGAFEGNVPSAAANAPTPSDPFAAQGGDPFGMSTPAAAPVATTSAPPQQAQSSSGGGGGGLPADILAAMNSTQQPSLGMAGGMPGMPSMMPQQPMGGMNMGGMNMGSKPQQQMQMGGGGMGMGGMPQQQMQMGGMVPQQQMGMMGGMMPQQQMGMMGGMMPQQQMGMMGGMMPQQQMQQMGGGGMMGMGGGMMPQQQMGMMGGMMPQQQVPSPPQPAKKDPFADFGL